MLRLQTYLMIDLHVPHLLWQAIDVAYRLALWNEMQEIAVAAGFELTGAQFNFWPNIVAKQYRYNSTEMFFSFQQDGILITEWEKITEVATPYNLAKDWWHMKDGLFFFNRRERSFKEWRCLYQKKICEYHK